jgi:hypothetical protein
MKYVLDGIPSVLYTKPMFYIQVIFYNVLTRCELEFSGLDQFNYCRLNFVTVGIIPFRKLYS